MSSISIGSSKLILAEFMKNAVNQAAGVDIVPNHEQEKATQVCTTWVKEKARQFGKSAKNLMKRYPDQTFVNLMRLIDLTGADDQEKIDRENSFCLAKVHKPNIKQERVFFKLD